MKAILLRVGIDKGSGGVLAPIFSDGSFEYIPIPEEVESTESQTYNNTLGRTGKPLGYYVPLKIRDNIIHFDPEFKTFTYGDPSSKRNFLLKLDKKDLLVFYAGLTPYENEFYPEALYIIGYFIVKEVIDFNKLSESETQDYMKQYHNDSPHQKKMDLKDLIIVAGYNTESKLLNKAIIISQPKLNKAGRTYHAVSREIEMKLKIQGSIQRSIPPRIIENQKNIENLKKYSDYKFKIDERSSPGDNRR